MTKKVWALVGIALFCGTWLAAQKSAGKLTADDLVEIQQGRRRAGTETVTGA